MGRTQTSTANGNGRRQPVASSIMDGEARAMLMSLPPARTRAPRDAAPAYGAAAKPSARNDPWGTASWICT